ncbi:hypothetical protein MAR_020537, partial [Mya arenaria]
MATQTVNNKGCAQCDLTFKKSQKSMNCSVCLHWFCLDCSHISNKLYETLKNEPSTKNLPFNCDGCTRVLPKLTEFGRALLDQKQQIQNCEQKVEDLKKSMDVAICDRVELAIKSYREREERKCNVIIHNVPEPDAGSENKKEDDEICIKKIMEVIDCQDVNIVKSVRLGAPGTKPRLIKVQLDSVSDKHHVLGGTRLLRTKRGEEYAHAWNKVFITPDQSKEEREKSMMLKRELERRRTNEGNKNLVIFRGEIIERGANRRASGITNLIAPAPRFQLVSDENSINSYRSVDNCDITVNSGQMTSGSRVNESIDSDIEVQVTLINPDFIFVSEVLPKLNHDNVSCSSVIYALDGYTAFPSTDDGRGVLIYAKSELNISPNVNLNLMYHDASWIDWIVEDETVVIGCIYRSPSETDNCDIIIELLREAARISENLLVTGDFNMKDIEWETYTTIHSESHHEYMFIECLRDNFLFQHVQQFTRCRNDQPLNLLDLVLSKDENNVTNFEHLPSIGLSDHVTLVFDFCCNYKEVYTGNMSYSYRRCNLPAFVQDWESVNWKETLCDSDVNEMWSSFSEKYKVSVDKYVPKSKPKTGCKTKPLWMSGEVLSHIKKKRHAWDKYLATRRNEDYEAYKIVRNRANDFVKNSKRQYERNISQKAKSEPKQFWRYVKSKTKSRSNISNLKRENGEFVRNDKEKVDLLNEFFTTVFTKENIDTIPDIEDKDVNSELSSLTVSEEEVLKLLKDIDPSKSMGPDCIHPFLLKSMPDIFVEPLTIIFNKSVNTGK